MITAFEPDPVTFKILQRNIKNNQINNVTCINTALSNSTKTTSSFFINTSQPGALQMSTTHRWDNYEQKITVSSSKLSKFIKNINTKIDLIKMDIEGMETEVINDLFNSNYLKNTDNIIIEYHHHILPNIDKFSQILLQLEKSNFAYQLTTNIVHLPFSKNYFQDIMLYAYQKTNCLA